MPILSPGFRKDGFIVSEGEIKAILLKTSKIRDV
jgi:hypothetical protein